MSAKFSLVLVSALYGCQASHVDIIDDASSAVKHHTFCNNLEDGQRWIRPITGQINGKPDTNDYNSIQVKCDDGWTILDYSLDSNVEQYFSSFSQWTDDAASSTLSDRVSWTQWFLPFESEMLFRVSPDCQSCDETTNDDDFESYYMTANYIGCLWATKAYCDMDPSTLECYSCLSQSNPDYEMSGLCTHVAMSPDTQPTKDHDDCVSGLWNAVPSLSTVGQYCTCVKPVESQIVAANIATDNTDNSIIDSNDCTNCNRANHKIELSNDDFTDGTYRITQSGTYTLTEDILLNMNPASDYSSANEEYAWFPTENQIDMYAGAEGTFVGAYSMGFFAALTVECDDVIVDLNGYKMEQSFEFYLQQRFFAHIELGSKPFINGQGPGNFAGTTDQASNVIIRNGELGLTSHHGIHGNYVTNLVIQNVKIYDFEVSGIALNGFHGVTIEHVEVGPSYDAVPVTGIYTQGRVMLGRLRTAYLHNPDTTVSFAYRDGEFTAADIADELEDQMNMVFEHTMGLVDYDETELDDEDSERWEKAKRDFINPRGLPVGSTVYGIFLNSIGAAVFGVGLAPGYSYNAILSDVKVHKLRNEPWETVRVSMVRGPFNDLLDMDRIAEPDMSRMSESTYVGSAYSDAQYAIHEISTEWGVLGHSYIASDVKDWIVDDTKFTDDAELGCNSDVMLHVTKGIFGLRVDNVVGITMDNIDISDLVNMGMLGHPACGAYTEGVDGGHRNQNFPIQTGYTGTEVHALTFIQSSGSIHNIHIHNILSARGDALALQFYPGNDISVGKATISNIHSGATLDKNILDEPFLPNKHPKSCIVDVWTYLGDEDTSYYEYDENKMDFSSADISVACVTSHHTTCESRYQYDHTLKSNSAEACAIENGDLIDASDFKIGKVLKLLSESDTSFANDEFWQTTKHLWDEQKATNSDYQLSYYARDAIENEGSVNKQIQQREKLESLLRDDNKESLMVASSQSISISIDEKSSNGNIFLKHWRLGFSVICITTVVLISFAFSRHCVNQKSLIDTTNVKMSTVNNEYTPLL